MKIGCHLSTVQGSKAHHSIKYSSIWQSCDRPECGFDAGDCGDANLASLPKIDVLPGSSVYNFSLTLTQPSFVLNFTRLERASPGDLGLNVTGGVHGPHAGLRAVALSLKYRCVVVVVYKDAKNLTELSLKLTGSRGGEEVSVSVLIK
jgi:UDP-N-acetylglucosamine-lysosomal-enzyme